MKYLLIFWLGHGQPVTAVFDTAYSCKMALPTLQSMAAPDDKGIRANCMHMGGTEKTYPSLWSAANPGTG